MTSFATPPELPLAQELSLEQYERRTPFLYRGMDVALIALVMLVTSELYDQRWIQAYWSLAFSAGAAFFLLATLLETYRCWRIMPLGQELARLWTAWGLVVFLILLGAYAAKQSDSFSRVVMTVWFMATPLLLTVWHILMRLLPEPADLQNTTARAVIAGVSPAGRKIADAINSSPGLHLKVWGFYDDDIPVPSKTHSRDWHRHVGGLEDLVRDAHDGVFDLVYINLPPEQHGKVRELATQLADTTVSVYYILPDNITVSQLTPQWHHLAGVHAVSIFESPFSGGQHRIKRLEDFVLASLILVLIAPVMLLIALGVKLSSPGPVLFRQVRYGIGGHRFNMLKFRSMRTMDNGPVVKQATRVDPRITPLGRFLRRRSLDELPQFINVLMGDMSIVGPRPHAAAHNEEYRLKITGYMLRHKVKPGITGLAQINGCRGETDTPDKMERRIAYDLAYIRSWSLWLDLKIIFLSIFRGFSDPNAY